MSEIVSVEFLKANGFSLESFLYRKWWVRRSKYSIIQVNESRFKAVVWEKGVVNSNLTFKQIQKVIEAMDRLTLEEFEP